MGDYLQLNSARAEPLRLGAQPQITGSVIFSELAWGDIGRSLKLSGRELQIVRRVFDDHTDRAIALELGISHHTVKTHLERLHQKLGVTDRVQVVLRVTREFLALALAQRDPVAWLSHQQTSES